MAYSVSVSVGDGNIDHNTRENTAYAPHVDKSKSHLNVDLMKNEWEKAGCSNPKEYHEKLVNEYIGPGIELSNPLKAKKDRWTGTAWEYLHQKDNQLEHYFDEEVVQIGNMDDHPDRETTIKAYQLYLDEFRKANPNKPVFSASIHFDEKGAPHMHMSYLSLYEKDCFERDENGEIIFQKTAKGKLTNRPQQKFIRDKNGNIELDKKGKPKFRKLRGLPVYLNRDKSIYEQGVKTLEGNKKALAEWEKMSTKARFKVWQAAEMERLHESARAMGLETKTMGVRRKHKHHALYKEMISRVMVDMEPAVEQIRKQENDQITMLAIKDTEALIELDSKPELSLVPEPVRGRVEKDIDIVDEVFQAPVQRLADGKVQITMDEKKYDQAQSIWPGLKEAIRFLLRPVKTLRKWFEKHRNKLPESQEMVEEVVEKYQAKKEMDIGEIKESLSRKNTFDLQRLRDEIMMTPYKDMLPSMQVELDAIWEILAERGIPQAEPTWRVSGNTHSKGKEYEK